MSSILDRFREGSEPARGDLSLTAQRAADHLRECPTLTVEMTGEDGLTAVASCSHGRRASWYTVKICGDCHARPGEPHSEGCDVARCLYTGGQRLSCDRGTEWLDDDTPVGEPHDCGDDIWTGRWPGAAEAEEFGWRTRWTDHGWERCGPDDPGARPDLNRLMDPRSSEVRWDREAKRWVRRSPVRLSDCRPFEQVLADHLRDPEFRAAWEPSEADREAELAELRAEQREDTGNG